MLFQRLVKQKEFYSTQRVAQKFAKFILFARENLFVHFRLFSTVLFSFAATRWWINNITGASFPAVPV